MTNQYYIAAPDAVPGTTVRSSQYNDNNDSIEQGFDQLPEPSELFTNNQNFAVATSPNTNEYVASISPTVVTTLNDGAQISVRVPTANTGAATLNLNDLGIVEIKTPMNLSLLEGDIAANSILNLTYNAAQNFWQLDSSLTAVSSAADRAETAATNAATSETNAAASAAAALASETAAALSEQSAATSATDAQTARDQVVGIAALPVINWAQGLIATEPVQRYLFDGNFYVSPTASTSNPITLGATPVGDPNWISWADPVRFTKFTATATAGQTVFNIGFAFETVADVYVNTNIQEESAYTVDGTAMTITLNEGLPAGTYFQAWIGRFRDAIISEFDTIRDDAQTAQTSATASAAAALASEQAAAASETTAAASAAQAVNSETVVESFRDQAETFQNNALASATDAATDADRSETARDAAVQAETNALASANAASNSETSVANNAAAAAASELNAGTSATNAANSASAAQTSATMAESARTAAETAATDAEAADVSARQAEQAAVNAQTTATAQANAASDSAQNAAASESAAGTSATNAANSASSASSSAGNAAESATNAGTSASNSANSATAAANSATSATNSANSASGSATAASNSASDAATSSTSAQTQANAAANSATQAANSASTAAGHANDAESSADNAQASEDAVSASAATAQASATAAATSASNAATSETNASNSATAAAGSATTAGNQATAATNSATTAMTQATAASTSAGEAANSATAAAGSATDAANSATAAATSETNAAQSASDAAAIAGTTYVAGGTFTPTSGTQYPSTTGVVANTVYIISLPSASATFVWTTGDLNGQTGASADLLLYNVTPGTFELIINGAAGAVTSVNSLTGTVVLTAADVDALPDTATVNGQALSGNPTLTAANVNAVPDTATVNGLLLTSNPVIDLSTLNALPNTVTINGELVSSNPVLDAADVGALPSTTTVNGVLLSSNPVFTATTTGRGMVELATGTETVTGTDTDRAVTPQGLSTLTATSTRRGLLAIATNSETVAGSIADKAVTPFGLDARLNLLSASDVGALTQGTADTRYLGITANAVSASRWANARTFTLTGDVTGSVSIDGSANVSVTATVTDDSHAHTIANIDGLQTALDGKLDTTGGTFLGNVGIQTTGQGIFRVDAGTNQDASIQLSEDSQNHGAFVRYNGSGDNSTVFGTRNANTEVAFMTIPRGSTTVSFPGLINVSGTQRVFADNYHPNADRWTTARTLTLTGDVTGSVSITGASDVSLTATVANNSHTHTIANVTNLQTELDGKLDDNHTINGVLVSSNPVFNASSTARGMVELATTAEVQAGTDSTRAVVPSTLRAETSQSDTANRIARRTSSGDLVARFFNTTSSDSVPGATPRIAYRDSSTQELRFMTLDNARDRLNIGTTHYYPGTITSPQTVFSPGIPFTRAQVFAGGVAQRIGSAFTISQSGGNGVITFSEAIPAGTEVFAELS